MAAISHDNGWMIWEQRPELDTQNRPVDFLDMAVSTHLDLWRQGVERLARQSLYGALLVSMHGRALVEGRLNSDRQDSETDRSLLAAFSAEQRTWEAAVTARLRGYPHYVAGCEAATLAANLRLLQVFDWFSLLCCMRALAPANVGDIPGQSVEQRVTVEMIPLGPQSLTMQPWPFKVPEFAVTVQAHKLPQPTFATVADFQTAWQETAPQPMIFQLRHER